MSHTLTMDGKGRVEQAVHEALDRLDDTRALLPIVLDPSRLRPPAEHVIVRCDPFERQKTSRGWEIASDGSLPTFNGTIVAIGAGVTQVAVGDRVVVETMSGHACMTSPLEDAETGRLLAIVPCRVPDPIQARDHIYVRRQTRLAALEKVFQGLPDKHIPPKALAEIRELRATLHDMREARRGQCRSRLWKPIRDKARGQGILAVIEEE